MCLHSIEITNIVTSNEIITLTNRKKTFKTELLKKILLGNFNSISVAFLSNKKFSFSVESSEQSLLMS